MYKLCEIKEIREKLVVLKAQLTWQERELKERNYKEAKKIEYFERLDNMINEEDIF